MELRHPRPYTPRIEKDKPRSSRFSVAAGPTCPNCTLNRSRRSIMKGPFPDPAGESSGLYFVCDRCKWKMKDRRSSGRADKSDKSDKKKG
jgi:hypothetical protein